MPPETNDSLQFMGRAVAVQVAWNNSPVTTFLVQRFLGSPYAVALVSPGSEPNAPAPSAWESVASFLEHARSQAQLVLDTSPGPTPQDQAAAVKQSATVPKPGCTFGFAIFLTTGHASGVGGPHASKDAHSGDETNAQDEKVQAQGVAIMARVLNPGDSPALLDYARQVQFTCDRMLELHQNGKVDEAIASALHLGLLFQWMIVCTEEYLVAEGNKHLFNWRGLVCRVTAVESRILSFFHGKSQAPIGDFVRAVWREAYKPNRRSKYDTALSRLSAKLSAHQPSIRVPFAVRADQVIRIDHA